MITISFTVLTSSLVLNNGIDITRESITSDFDFVDRFPDYMA